MTKYVVVFVTAPAKAGKKLAKHLLNKKLVACVNEIKGINSFYWWEQKVCNDKENLLVMKTTKNLVKKLIKEIKKIHPYQVPEIISIPVIEGNKDYLRWVKESLS